MKLSIQAKFFFSHFLAILMVSGSIGTYFYQSAIDNVMNTLKSRLLNSAALLSSGFDVNELDGIRSKSDMESQVYRACLKQVREVVATNPDISFIYIMRKMGDEVQFVIDSDPEPAAVGEVYEEHVLELLEGFIRPSVDKEIVSDKWGDYLSGYAPLKNGQGLYLVGIDMRADQVKKKFIQIRLAGLISLLLSIILATVFSFFLSRHFTAKIDYLMDRCKNISDEGILDMDRSILPATGDELDLLTKAFNRMAGNLETSRQLTQKAKQELQIANEGLEQRVRERTRELERMNEQLLLEIRERERVEKILEKTARTDYLTNLLNRRAMMQRLDTEVSRAKRHHGTFSVVMLDIDRFKSVNDTYGHPAGDELLMKFAARLKLWIRDSDEPARWGGEEFLILLPSTGLEEARDQALRLQEKLSETDFRVDGSLLKITASFGVGEYALASNLEALLQQVDAGLYQAKSQGRNRVIAMG